MKRLAVRTPGRVLVAVAAATGFSWMDAARVSAHPIDEVLQQVYVTPTAHGIDIDVELTAGVAVAPELVTLIDIDGDGQISSTEASTHTGVVLSMLSLAIDGQPVAARVMGMAYPDEELIAAGGGTIILQFTADAPPTGGMRSITVTNAYAPTTKANDPLLTAVQANLTPSIDAPLDVASIEHDDGGRTLTASYTDEVADAALLLTGDGLDANDQAPASASTIVNALTSRWAFAVLVAGSALLRVLVVLRRRPRHGV